MRNKIRAAGKFLSVFESRMARDVGVLSPFVLSSFSPALSRLSTVMSWRPRLVTRNYSWNRHRSLYSIQRAWISPDYRICVAHAKYRSGRYKWNSRNPLKGFVRTSSNIPGNMLLAVSLTWESRLSASGNPEQSLRKFSIWLEKYF